MRKSLLIAVVVATLLGAGFWLLGAAEIGRVISTGTATSAPLMQAPSAPPTVAAPTATPNIITVGTSTPVLFTVSIPEPTLNPASVELLRVGANGTTSVMAQMVDNGQNGDERPGDKVFTARLALNEPLAGEAKFQVSAAFRGLLNRSISAVASVPIWSRLEDPHLGYRLDYPPQYYISQQSPVRLLVSNTPNQATDGDQQGMVTLFISPRVFSEEMTSIKESIVTNYSETAMPIGGIQGVAITGLFGPNVFGWGGQTYTIVLATHRGRTFLFSYNSVNPMAQALFQQLLSRLMFI